MPYLPIDPVDLNCTYEAVIRVNSQSGKGGASWLLEQNHGLKLPRNQQTDFSEKVKSRTNSTGCEMSLNEIWQLFRESYGVVDEPRLYLAEYKSEVINKEQHIHGTFCYDGKLIDFSGKGAGVLSALMDALRNALTIEVNIKDYSEHTLGNSTNSRAVTYVEIETRSQKCFYGVSINSDTLSALLQATLNAVSNSRNKSLEKVA